MDKKPNILFIMSDDHAANAISCYGSILSEVFKTPSLDSIATNGLRFDNCFSTNPICTPARATIMTGQYGHKNGVRTLSDVYDGENSLNVAKILSDNGYNTSLFGKWHLHSTPVGFDEYKILSGEHGQGTYQNPEFEEKDTGIKTYDGYVTDIITDMTVEHLEKVAKDKRPFFMMCHHKAPHDFWEYAERHEHLFDGIDIPVPDSLFEDKSHRSEASREFGSSVTPRSKIRSLYEDFSQKDYVTGPLEVSSNASFEEKGIAAYQKYLKDYLRTVAGIDDSVGKILKTLKKLNILEDTIVIYTSDQGMYLGEHDYQDKRWCFEEALKVPFLMMYPKKLPKKSINKNLISNIDIAPTILDFCGIEVPNKMQGVSQKVVIENENNDDLIDSIYFRYWMHLAHRHHNPAHLGIRTKDYKLIYFYGHPLDANGAECTITPQGFELYDMKQDPLELNNLYEKEEYAAVRKTMMEKLREVKQRYEDFDEKFSEIVTV